MGKHAASHGLFGITSPPYEYAEFSAKLVFPSKKHSVLDMLMAPVKISERLTEKIVSR